jgi:hypothetical protein
MTEATQHGLGGEIHEESHHGVNMSVQSALVEVMLSLKVSRFADNGLSLATTHRLRHKKQWRAPKSNAPITEQPKESPK